MRRLPIMSDSNTTTALLAILPSTQLQSLLLKAIKENNPDLVKALLTDNRLDLEKTDYFDPMETAKSNEKMMSILSDYEKKIDAEILDILLNSYDKIDYSKPAVRKNIILRRYWDHLKGSVKPVCLTLPIKTDHNINPTPYAVSKSDASFGSDFRTRLGNTFDKIDWSNIIVAGGFISSLVETDQNGRMSENSDVDLFVYGPIEDIVKKKYEYLMTYFEQFDATFILRDSLIHVYMPKSKHVIQIIPMIGKTPIEIINDFDFNYVSMYYDGHFVHTNVLGLIACKYALAIHNPNARINGNLNKRIYKTILKGFKIRYSDTLKSKSDIVKPDYIDIRSLENDSNLNTQMNNLAVMIKTLPKIESSKQLDFIKLIFGAESVAKIPPTISNILTRFDFDKYGQNPELRTSNQINFASTPNYHFLLNDKSEPMLQRMDIKPNSAYYDFISDATTMTISIKIDPEFVSLPGKEDGVYGINVKINPETIKLLHKYRKNVANKLNINETPIRMYESNDTIKVYFYDTTEKDMLNRCRSKSEISVNLLLCRGYNIKYVAKC